MIPNDKRLIDLTVGEFKELFTNELRDLLRSENDLLCTYEQAAIMLNISKALLYKYVRELKLHPVKQHGNKQKFIKTSELSTFMTSKKLFIRPLKD